MAQAEDAAAAAAAQPAAAHAQRPRLVGPDAPEEPFPLFVAGEVVRGFGRGSRELGIPTANLPEEVVSQLERLATGVYYGWARVSQVKDAAVLGDDEGVVYPMVMSVGWNPYYKNEKRSAEVHIMHEFKADFYGARLAVAVLGYIRPELDYTTLDALISDINFDIKVANNCLARPAYKSLPSHLYYRRISPRSLYEAAQRRWIVVRLERTFACDWRLVNFGHVGRTGRPRDVKRRQTRGMRRKGGGGGVWRELEVLEGRPASTSRKSTNWKRLEFFGTQAFCIRPSTPRKIIGSIEKGRSGTCWMFSKGEGHDVNSTVGV